MDDTAPPSREIMTSAYRVLARAATPGFWLTTTETTISGRAAFISRPATHLLIVTLGGGTARTSIRTEGARGLVTRRDRVGAISLVPQAHLRRTILANGQLAAAHLEFDPEQAASACGVSPDRFDWRPAANESDPVLLRLAKVFAAAAGQSERPLLWFECLAAATMRRAAERFGGMRFRPDDSHLDPVALRRVVDLIQSQLAEPPSLARLAQEASLSPSAFARAFRGSLGVGPGEFLLRCRLDHAAILLASSSLPIATIATRCGFSSQAHLSHAYARRFGLPPGRDRRQHR